MDKTKKISYQSLKEKLSDEKLKRIIAGSGGGEDDRGCFACICEDDDDYIFYRAHQEDCEPLCDDLGKELKSDKPCEI